jgi:hypothetical protein
MCRHFIPGLVLLVGCAVEPADQASADQVLPFDAQVGVPGIFDLTVSPMVVGRPFTIRVSNAAANQNLCVYRARSTVPGGFCPGTIAPDCLDIPAGSAVLQFSTQARNFGLAVINANLPATLGAPQVVWQAVGRRR